MKPEMLTQVGIENAEALVPRTGYSALTYAD